MRKPLLWTLALASLACSPLASGAATSVGLSVSIGNAPPPPVVVIREQPHVMLIRSSSVYVVEDEDEIPYDMFRYGVFWYVYNDNYWYRARSYRGPFTVVEARYVPRPIFDVPARHWRHHPHGGPPGLTKRGWVAEERHNGRGKGRGRDRD